VSGDDLDEIVFSGDLWWWPMPMFVIFHVNVHKASLFCEARGLQALLQE
jgi:hypothetical protein